LHSSFQFSPGPVASFGSKLPWTLPLAFHLTVASDAERDWRQPWILGWERLCSTQHKRPQVAPTNSRHSYGVYPNLLKGLQIVRPNQVWAADLTYIRMPRQFVYLAVLLDVFTRAIRGWELSGSLSEELTKAALQGALAQEHPEIHHSDQGVQYAAHGYVQLLQGAQVQMSMAAKGTPTDNAFVERFMRTLKEEEVYLHEYRDLADARAHIGRFLEEVYMCKRLHSSLGYLPPAEFEAQWQAEQLAIVSAAGFGDSQSATALAPVKAP
jgi:putative transposase